MDVEPLAHLLEARLLAINKQLGLDIFALSEERIKRIDELLEKERLLEKRAEQEDICENERSP